MQSAHAGLFLPLIGSVLFALLSISCLCRAADFYVSRQGSDLNAGTLGAPWRTIQMAADALSPGDTAFVRAGIYRERVTVNVSGDGPDRLVTIRNFPGETPVVDGTGLRPPIGQDTALFLVADRKYVVIRGFEIRNYQATRGNRVPAGVFITGASHDVEIRENDIHHIRYDARGGNAFGIAVYGRSADAPITGVVIDGNEVHHLKTGNSECIAVNGNVSDFEVTNNFVHHNNNIGIDFIGFEGTCPDPNLDQARDGVCRGNVVWKISSFGNPAYGRQFSAGGIYVDGGTRLVIERNRLFNNDIGIELASEHPNRATSAIIVRNNLIYRNRIGGLFLGGFDAQRGSAEFCRITHNTFFENDTRRDGNGEIYFQHQVRNNTLTHNLIVAGRQSLLVGNPAVTNEGNVLDYNLFFAPDGIEASRWEWRRNESVGFDAYRSFSGQDVHSLFVDPKFVSPSTFDLHLREDSAAIDAGDPSFAPADVETDFDGQPRMSGGRVDIGADEYQQPVSRPAPGDR